MDDDAALLAHDAPREDDRPCECAAAVGRVARCGAVVALVWAGAAVVAARRRVYRRSDYNFFFAAPDPDAFVRFLDRGSSTAPGNFSAEAFLDAYAPTNETNVTLCTTGELERLYLGKTSHACSYGKGGRECRGGYGLDSQGEIVGCDSGFFCSEDFNCAVPCPFGAFVCCVSELGRGDAAATTWIYRA